MQQQCVHMYVQKEKYRSSAHVILFIIENIHSVHSCSFCTLIHQSRYVGNVSSVFSLWYLRSFGVVRYHTNKPHKYSINSKQLTLIDREHTVPLLQATRFETFAVLFEYKKHNKRLRLLYREYTSGIIKIDFRVLFSAILRTCIRMYRAARIMYTLYVYSPLDVVWFTYRPCISREQYTCSLEMSTVCLNQF